MYNFTFGAFMGGGKFRSLLYHHLDPESPGIFFKSLHEPFFLIISIFLSFPLYKVKKKKNSDSH